MLFGVDHVETIDDAFVVKSSKVLDIDKSTSVLQVSKRQGLDGNWIDDHSDGIVVTDGETITSKIINWPDDIDEYIPNSPYAMKEFESTIKTWWNNNVYLFAPHLIGVKIDSISTTQKILYEDSGIMLTDKEFPRLGVEIMAKFGNTMIKVFVDANDGSYLGRTASTP